jgi:hypothetical protein
MDTVDGMDRIEAVDRIKSQATKSFICPSCP